MFFLTVKYNSPEYQEIVSLRNRILREPINLLLTEEDIIAESMDIFCAAQEHGKIIACCILTHSNEEVVKLRQMAVDSEWQGKQIGAGLLAYSENVARKAGYKKIVLHARMVAKDFYLKKKYKSRGAIFEEVGIPHIEMVKEL